MIITFKDHGQDFLEWELDEKGVVVESRPFQTSIWAGNVILDYKRLEVGDLVHYFSKEDGQLNTINYPIESISN
jgi:hypothetical protein